jgi:uncharacterized RDD family membrane protein YckC
MEEMKTKSEVTSNANNGVFKFFLKRAAAFIIDYLLVLVTAVVFAILIGLFFRTDVAFSENALTYFIILVFGCYYTYMLGKYGYTIGKKLLKLKVVKNDGSKLTYVNALIRFLGTLLSSLILVGYIIMFFNAKRKNLHDYIAGTIVEKM